MYSNASSGVKRPELNGWRETCPSAYANHSTLVPKTANVFDGNDRLIAHILVSQFDLCPRIIRSTVRSCRRLNSLLP